MSDLRERIADAIARLPVIRHIRAMVFSYRCNRHYDRLRPMFPMGGWSAEEVEHWRKIKRGEA